MIVDSKVLDKLRQFEDENNPGNLAEIIKLFLQISSQRITALYQALLKSDVIEVEKIAHSLRGSSISLGARQMSAICEELELKGNCGSLQGTDIILNQLEYEFAQVRKILELETAKQKSHSVSA